MATVAKRKYTLAILAFVLANMLLPLVYMVSVKAVKIIQSQKIGNANHTETLTLTETQFAHYFVDDENELNINGHMYDVVSHTKHKGQYIFTVIADDDETLLHKLFGAIGNNLKHQQKSRIVPVFLMYSNAVNLPRLPLAKQLNYTFPDYTKSRIHPGFIKVLSPPPKA